MKFFVFDPFSPPYPGAAFWGGAGGGVSGGGGSKLLCEFWVLCVDLDSGPGIFFLVHGPPNPWRGSRVLTPGTPGRPPPPRWALASEDLAVFTLDKAV